MKPMMIAALGFGLALGVPSGAALAAGGGDGGGTTASTPTSQVSQMAAAKELIKKHRYKSAVTALLAVVSNEPRNADAWNLLGYSSRKLQRYQQSETYYAKALRIEPAHIGALEYQGELFVETGRVELARANLEKLKAACGVCQEYRELRDVIREATGS